MTAYRVAVISAFLPLHATAYVLVLSGLFLVGLAEHGEALLGVRR